MKKYSSIGDLLIDYRVLNKISQSDLAALFEVDIRTIIRWEKNETLLKPDKEEAMVDITFIPYQVIRNLNAPVSIPTFYDFDIRKYSLGKISNDFPDANWLKAKMNTLSDRLRTISHDSDIDDIIRCSLVQKHISKPISRELISKAIGLLPELNLILFDNSGYYSGHSVFFPLKRSVYNRIRDRSLKEEDLTVQDFVGNEKEINPVYYAYDMNADCNDNMFLIIGAIMKYFKELSCDYTYASYTSRHDTYDVNHQLGTTLVWEDKVHQDELNSKAPPRLYEANLTEFLKEQ